MVSEMKKSMHAILCFFLAAGCLIAQEKRSKADVHFFEYAYADAIAEYKKESQRKPLSLQQQLNLAEAYLKTKDFEEAMETYLEVFKKDTLMTGHHYNNMFRAMARTSGMDRVRAFLETKKYEFSPELLENADFNLELLKNETGEENSVRILNLRENSPQGDFAPAFYGDRLLFTSARSADDKKVYGPSGEAYLDIYVARLSPDGNIQNTNPYTDMPASTFHEATPYYSNSLKKLFYVLSNADDGQLTFSESGKNSLAIGTSDTQGNFSYLLRDLSTSFYYPFYEDATGKLYFAANFEDSFGGTDLYYAYTNNGMIMSAPVNLGPRINTPGNEIAPYIFDGTLYFSSDVYYGLGGMDLYKADIQQDGSFSIPVNLGSALNSEQDDFGLILRKDETGSLSGYFASNRPGGKGNDDLYAFRSSEKPGLKTLVFRGRALNPESSFGIEKVEVSVLAPDSSLLKRAYTTYNGSFRIEIPARDSVILRASRNRYASYEEAFGTQGLAELQGKTLEIPMPELGDVVRQSDEGLTVLKMDKFFFERNASRINPDIATQLDKAVTAMRQFPDLRVRIEAHTDSRGSSTSNQRLSQARADAIRKYLTDQGIPADHITEARGFGEERILNTCKDGVYCLEILHKQNERQWIVVTNYEDFAGSE